MNKEFVISIDIEELSEFIPHLLSHTEASVKFPEKTVSKHSAGTFYRLDAPTLTTLIVSISSSATTIVAFITAIISFQKERAKQNTNKSYDSHA